MLGAKRKVLLEARSSILASRNLVVPAPGLGVAVSSSRLPVASSSSSPTGPRHVHPASVSRLQVTPMIKNSFMQATARRMYSSDTTRVPDFAAYKKDSSADPSKGRALTYVMFGTTGFISAVGAKNFVQDFLVQLTPSDAVLALAKAEVDLSVIPEGKNVTIKWRGKPVFIRHRTQEEIDEANGVAMTELRDPQSDLDRVKKPEFLVVLGVCTHLGCVPIGEAGDYNAWYCPCHGSHYDISGRIRKGPAPLNLEVPPYEFSEEGDKLIIG
eukprot:Partr_v1_DN24019_c0_g1_i1_m34798 putative Component of the ubiquinol-cytochrome c reductase complex (complex III or cytochrome b-c1 complex), which is a respiratory chain that generates an electrochemical potential coupled to ATP synthesis (By similarity)